MEYTLGRVPIASTDYSRRTYSYDDSVDVDFNLSRFALADEDIQLKVS